MQSILISQPRGLIAMSLMLSLTACYPTHGVKSELAATHYNEVCEAIEGSSPRTSAQCAEANDVAHDITTARRCVNEKRKRYERYFCEQEWSNKHFNYSLIGTALIAGGAALAKANPYVLGGIGLAAGGISGLKTYQHPDTDRDASIAAYEQLTCIYDRSHILNHNQVEQRLEYDRGALHKAIGAVNADLAGISPAERETAAGKAAVKAAQTALDAGAGALKQIATSLGDYKTLPGLIDVSADAIDVAARKAFSTNGSYSGFQSAIKDAYTAAAKDAAGKDDTADKAAAAKGAAAVATSVAGALPSAKPSNALFQLVRASKAIQPNSEMLSILERVGPSGELAARAELRAPLALADATSSDVVKLAAVAAIAVDDLPFPLYSAVIADINTCSPKK